MERIFLLSPAHCGGERARLILNPRAGFPLARLVRSAAGAPLGDVFTFLSGLYFRGKLAYARAFASPPPGLPGVLVITPTEGLRGADRPVGIATLRRYARVGIDEDDARYRRPLLRDLRRLEAGARDGLEVVLLGSVSTRKYLDTLTEVLGERLSFPAAFLGRGDMSRGSLLLRAAAAGCELEYLGAEEAPRRGARAGGRG
jgi:hypothetical protein